MVESSFFQDLAVFMVLVGFVAAVFSRFGWPKAIGYILAGVLMSEHTWGGAFLLDAVSIRTLAQLGIVFLMFGMGLGFSAKDMSSIRNVAIPVAAVDVITMTWLGWFVGTRFFHWGNVPSLFLGVAICDSATTLLAKVLDEMGWGRRVFAKYVLGTSVCEDILCVGLIAVATGFARGGGMNVSELLTLVGKLLLFFVTVLVFGMTLVPRLLRSVGRRKDNESLLLVMLACCFFVTYLAYAFQFSSAIGAFLAGLVCATSVERTRLGALLDPLKSMFSAMFFMTIGLLVDPVALWHCLPMILVVALVIVVGKSVNILAMSLATGLEVKAAVQNALSLAQVGEFAFMTALLYSDLKGGSDSSLFQIAIGASLLTTLLNPLMIRISDPVGDFVVRHLTPKSKRLLAEYRSRLSRIGASRGSLAYKMARWAAFKILLFAALILAVGLSCAFLSKLDYSRFSTFFERWDKCFFVAVANLFAVSLLPLILGAVRSLGDEVTDMVVGPGTAVWQTPMRHLVRFLVRAAVCTLLLVEVLAINLTAFHNSSSASWGIVLVAIVAVRIGWSFVSRTGRRAASQLYEAITAQDRAAGDRGTVTFEMPEGSFARLVIPNGSPAAGHSIGELNVRSRTGVNVISIRRDGVVHHDFGPDWAFAAGDILGVLGDASQIVALKKLIAVSSRD